VRNLVITALPLLTRLAGGQHFQTSRNWSASVAIRSYGGKLATAHSLIDTLQRMACFGPPAWAFMVRPEMKNREL
jgi:hypothetical protein